MSAIFTEDDETIDATAANDDALPALCRGGGDPCARWIMLFLAVGVAARLLRYLLRFPLWGDEAMLAINFLDRGYAGLMRPLDFHQVAPLLFLWIELTAVKLLGFHEWSLRLFPLLCGIASLFLFHRMARLLLRGPALVLSVGMFAVTYSSIRYATEVKPYSVDLLAATLLLLLAVRWWRQPGETRWLWMLAAVVPLALGVSFPAVFVGGGVSLAVAAVLLGTRSRRGWLAWGVYNVALAGSFLAWYQLAVAAQAGAELNMMARMWDDAFPPRDSLLNLLAWLPRVHAGPLLAVPVGGDNWGSIGTALICLVGVWVLLRQRRYRLLVLCGATFGLNLAAAALRRYPYGGHMRLTLHVVPLVCLLAGIGAAAISQWLGRKRASRFGQGCLGHNERSERCPSRPKLGLRKLSHQPPREVLLRPSETLTRPATAALVALLMLAVLSTARDFVLPGKEQQDIRKRDFARWFWGSMERDHEVVSISADLKRTFPPPGATWQNCVSPQLVCNEWIYSPRRARGQGYDLERVSRQRPLVCLQYWSHLTPYDQAAFAGWLDEMRQRYELISTQYYPILQDNDYSRAPEPPDRINVYELRRGDRAFGRNVP